MPGISRKDLLCPLPHWRNLWIPTHQNLNGGDPLLGEFEELSYRLQAEFEIIVWRSLAKGPPLDELLSSLLKFLMPLYGEDPIISTTLDQQISKLMQSLRSRSL
jgi:hypothetical protein